MSYNLDARDPEFAPSIETPCHGGFACLKAHLAMEVLADTHLRGARRGESDLEHLIRSC